MIFSRVPTSATAVIAAVGTYLQSFGAFVGTAFATFANAVMVSAIIHVVVIFGMTHAVVNPALFENSQIPIEVMLVNAQSKTRPVKPEVLAQHNLDGGGTVDEDRQASTPLPASAQDQRMSAEAETLARVQALEVQTKALMKQIKSTYQVPDQPTRPEAQPQPPTPVPAPTLAERSLEMARLQARIDQNLDEYQKRPRRAVHGASAQQFTFAQYVDDWRIKVERVGNQNYPEAAARNKLYGSLILMVCINADGTVESIDVRRSSQSKILDAAAESIVNRAAPYPPFSAEMRKLTDVFCIPRTWTFTRSDQLTSQ